MAKMFLETATEDAFRAYVPCLFLDQGRWQGCRPTDVRSPGCLTSPQKTIIIIENEQTWIPLDIPPDIPILIGMGYDVTAVDGWNGL